MTPPFTPLKSPINQLNASWEAASQWYDKQMGSHGWYYHQKLILPRCLKILRLHKCDEYNLLDLGCGQGVLSRHLPENGSYLGVDQSPTLIAKAKGYAKNQENQAYLIADMTQPLELEKESFTHAVILLSLQDSGDFVEVFDNAYKALKPHGTLLIVINHPCFRIPKITKWQMNRQKGQQSRLVEAYLSPRVETLKVHPSQKKSPTTLWHHHSLSAYSKGLRQKGFLIKEIYEWTSNKQSEGKYAKMENRAREEFPLFLAIEAIKYE